MMQHADSNFVGKLRRYLAGRDPVLLVALAIALSFSLYGVGWGRVESWNPDEMALRPLKGLRPSGYYKPPFHTYLNHLLVIEPIGAVDRIGQIFGAAHHEFAEAKMIGSHLVVIALGLGTICLAYAITLGPFGLFAARVTALIFASSAGFIEFNHFLTVETPLLFWMLLALYLCLRVLSDQRMSTYVWAGLMTGVAAATKYNGLAVGLGLVVAHLLVNRSFGLKVLLFDRKLWRGLIMMPLGFLAASPFLIFDLRRFISHFMFNYYVTPRYEGQQGHGYGQFVAEIPQIVGWPGAFVIGVAILFSSVIALRRRHSSSLTLKMLLVMGSVPILYFLEMGSFPRTPTRNVLPLVPFLILMAAPFWQALRRWPRAVALALAPVLAYNLLCCAYVGQRFRDDPRTAAQAWMEQHARPGDVIESSWGCPHWTRLLSIGGKEQRLDKHDTHPTLPGTVVDLRLPIVNGRSQLFSKIFAGNTWVTKELTMHVGNPNEQMFTLPELLKRNPDYVAVYSAAYAVRNQTVRTYYEDLLRGKFPYAIVSDGESAITSSDWFYPRRLDFVGGRITILRRVEGTSAQ